MIVNTLADEYSEDEFVPLTALERSRIQMICIPASRDGMRQVASFLSGQLWWGAQWSSDLHDLVTDHAAEVADQFADEPVVRAVRMMTWVSGSPNKCPFYCCEHPFPCAVNGPYPHAVVDVPSAAVLLRQVHPPRPGLQLERDRIDHLPVVAPPATSRGFP
ncbi:hypothetical protein [Streptomyces griseorubiginosus]|uniref:hypothetical protein n=1 Tax=Streptomyces griseorubiginosus TaxID=67304 RepID=UPI0015E83B09|nr:hypothetical protein [Streptomyces griseorubiginosus]